MNNGQIADTLVVQSEVLGERLRAEKFEASFHEVADSESVMNRVTASKSLVGRVEEGEKLFLFNNIGKLNPLFLRRITACWVVGASMENNNGSFGSVLQICTKTFEIDGSGVRIPVAVVVPFCESGTKENLLVVLPCWVLKQNLD